MQSITIRNPCQNYKGNDIKKTEMRGSCGTSGEEGNRIQGSCGET